MDLLELIIDFIELTGEIGFAGSTAVFSLIFWGLIGFFLLKSKLNGIIIRGDLCCTFIIWIILSIILACSSVVYFIMH